jgi:3-(3-hydroxy-phenyl)propionate hydroxylase
MVGFGVHPSASLSSDDVKAWTLAGGRFVQINPLGQPAGVSLHQPWEDLTGGLMPTVAPVGWVAIVRPDKVVMHDGPGSQAASMLKQVMGVLGAPDVQACAQARFA